jgi:hypothetical protein
LFRIILRNPLPILESFGSKTQVVLTAKNKRIQGVRSLENMTTMIVKIPLHKEKGGGSEE